MTKILLVEDDVALREIFQMRLIAEGYDTLTADNGEEGLVVAMKERPDLIISDVMMPKLSGFEMLETLRAAPEMANTKAVMMTALGQAEDRARGEKLGVVKYLVKSQVTLEDFVSVVREVVSPAPASATDSAASNGSQVQTNQPKESEAPMPPADQSTNPAPTADNSGADNPISGVPADTAQQSTEQEQSSVQDQINNFVSSGDDTAATTAPAPDAAAAAPTDGGSTAAGAPADSGSAFGGEPAAPAGGDGMATPAADTTAPEAPAASEPPAEAPQPPASTSTL